MCGIAAIARIDGGHLDTSADALLAAFADILAHRGPDESEVFRADAVGLAFTRLSLMDPAGGGQPLVSEDGKIALMANGEVYNHRELAARLPRGTRLRTGSDCEVLLHLYREHGVNFLDRVRGMFGLILWDGERNELVLARDRFGIKPLFYHRDAHRIVLGSEIKTLFAAPGTPRRLDWEAALSTPLLASAPSLDTRDLTTWFEGVRSVPAGTVLRIGLADGATHEHRYWEFPDRDSDESKSPREFVAAYRELLTQSVAECATAEAELGIFLSGGIDSAAVAALAVDRVPELHTFTALSAGTYRSEDAEHAHRLAEKLGLPNHQVVFEADRLPSPAEWKRLLWLLETPLCGPEVYYKHELHRYAKQVRPELRGMLLGAASDEFNGGYSVGLAEGGDWAAFSGNVRSMARAGALRARPDLAPWWTYGKAPLLRDEAIRRFAGQDLIDPYRAYLHWEYGKIQQYNVWHEDRTAAGSGIEARVPFLDHRLVELVTSIPARLRQELLWDKQILRSAMRGLLPDETVHRPKVPFFYGSGVKHTYRTFLRMLERDGGALVEEALAAPYAEEFIDGDALRATLKQLAAAPDDPQVEIALRVVNLGLLAGMAAQPPVPTRRAAAGIVPAALALSDWQVEQPEIERLVGLRPSIAPSMTPRLAQNVLLVNEAGPADNWFVLVDGSIEYVLDEAEPLMLSLLRALDGDRDVTAVSKAVGLTLDELRPLVIDLLDKDLITLD